MQLIVSFKRRYRKLSTLEAKKSTYCKKTSKNIVSPWKFHTIPAFNVGQKSEFWTFCPQTPLFNVGRLYRTSLGTVFLSKLNIEPGDRGKGFLSTFHIKSWPTIKCQDCMNFSKFWAELPLRKRLKIFGKASFIELPMSTDPIRSYPGVK